MHIANLQAADAFVTLDGSTIRELAGAVSLPAAKQSLAEASVPPGGATAEHFHRETEELYFFTSGRGVMQLEDERRDVRPGDCVVIPPGARHRLANPGDEPLRLLCSPPASPAVPAPGYRDDDTVLTEG